MFQKDYWERKSLAKRREPTHPVIRAYVMPKIKKIKEVIPITSTTTILDVGGGNGFFSYYFDRLCKATVVDYSEKMIAANPIKNKFVMDANNLKFKDNSFDIVFCHALLHHVEDFDQIIREMKRVARKHVVILEPNRNNPLMFLFSLIVKEENKALKFSLRYLRQKLQALDLRILSAFSYGLIVPNKTPKMLLPLLRKFNYAFPCGMTNFIICEKEN